MLNLFDTNECTDIVTGSEEGELSFLKGEILQVSRTYEKKWWPARNANGQVGGMSQCGGNMHDVNLWPTVVPSNFLNIEG